MVQKLLVKWLVAAVRLFRRLVAAVAVEVAAAAAVVAVVAAAAVAVVAAAAVAAVAEAEVVSVDCSSLVDMWGYLSLKIENYLSVQLCGGMLKVTVQKL